MWSVALNTGPVMILWTLKLPQHLNCLWPRAGRHRHLPELLCQTVTAKSRPRIRDLPLTDLPFCHSSVLQSLQCLQLEIVELCDYTRV